MPRGRPKGSKNKNKTKIIDSYSCGLCEIYQTILTNKRITTTSGNRSVQTRFCTNFKADVQKNTDACKDFVLAKIINCEYDNSRIYTLVCAYKYDHKLDDCGKCFIGEIASRLLKEI